MSRAFKTRYSTDSRRRPVSLKFAELFKEKEKDIRYKLFFDKKFLNTKRLNMQIRSAEMCLIMAESYAHLQDEDNALLYLNSLRAKRITDYVPLTMSSLPAVDNSALVTVDAEGKALTPLMASILKMCIRDRSDGTKVWLNAMSELRYPVAFSGDLREVELRGEAYFEVAENKNKPFIVRTDEFNVRVLGTSFNISAYADSPLALTTLCSGQVQLTDCMNPKNEQDLLPGEQLLFHRESRKMEIRNVDTDVFVSWREGFFQFDNHTVEEVFMILQRWYNVQVFYANTEVRLDCFTGKLPRFDNMMIIIDLIKRVSDLKITVDGKVIYIDK